MATSNRRIIRALLPALAALALASGSARADFGDNSVGMCVHIPPGDVIDACVELGVRWVRVDNNWFQNQPTSGAPVYLPALEDTVSYALASGLGVFMTIAYTPGWASSGDSDGIGSNDVPVAGTYGPFVRQAVAHYRAMGVTHFGLWNEPNLDGFWEGTSAQYVDLIVVPGLQAVAQGCADAGFSDCVSLGPELANVGECDVFLEETMTRMNTAGVNFDVYSHHIYQAFPETGMCPWDGDCFYNALDRRRSVFTRRSFIDVLTATGHAVGGVPDREVWISETGYRCQPPDDPGEMDIQETYYMRVIDEQLARAWYTNSFFYEIQDSFDEIDGFGILRRTGGPDATWSDNFLVKDAFWALQARIASEPAFQEAPCTLQCCDGADNDGDGLADMADPGCSSSDDDDESDDPVIARPLVEALPAAAVTLDGALDEWGDAVFVSLQAPDDFVSMDHPPTDAADIACRFALLWDSGALYFAVEVTDDLHDNASSADLIWLGDSVQAAFDMALNGGTEYDGTDDFELGWARTDGGDVGTRFAAPPAAPADASELAVAGSGGALTYEVRIPAASLGSAGFVEGGQMGFTMLVNDADGEGREGWIEWTPGIGAFKEPDAFGVLRLVIEAAPEPEDMPEPVDEPPPDGADASVDTVDDTVTPDGAADGVDAPDGPPADGDGGSCGCRLAR
jgi:hypothetical protein